MNHRFIPNCGLFLTHDKNPGLIFVELELHGLAHEIIENSPDVGQVIELCAFLQWVSDGRPVGDTRRLPKQCVLLPSLALLG